MMEEKWLIAVGAGRWQLPGIQAARKSGLSVLAIDGDADAPGFGAASVSIHVDIRDVSKVIAAIEKTAIKPSGAISFCNEAGMHTVAAIREHFDLPGARGTVTRALTNKGVQRTLWTQANLPCPIWAIVRTELEVPAVLERIDGTAIFKPVDSAGSRGVTVVRRGEAWDQAFHTALAGSLAKEVIVEEFISGVEHTVETFSHHGTTHILAITAKKKVPGTNNTVAFELASAQLDRNKRGEVTDVIVRALSALGYSDGPGHTEFLLTDAGEIYLVESAGRGGGFMVADGIVPQTSGFDMTRACALQAVGDEPQLPLDATSRSVVLRFVPSRAGRVRSFSGFELQNEIQGVQCEPMVSPGQFLGNAVNDGDRMAYILATADSIDEAQSRADAMESRLLFSMEYNDLPVFELNYLDRICECCGGDDLETLWHFNHYARTQSGYWAFRMGNCICKDCGFVFVAHSPVPAGLELYYNDTYPAGALSQPTYHSNTRIDLIQRFAAPGARIVDVGSSREEPFHIRLKELGMEVLRMDIKGHAMTDTGSLAAIAKESADVVTHYFVLEHVPQIRKFLADCSSILKPGGIMIIEVPDIRSYTKDWLGILPHEHVNHWSEGCLSHILSTCGFEVLDSGRQICSRNPIGFGVVCRKESHVGRLPVPKDEGAENRRSFQAGVANVRAYEQRLRQIHLAAQAELDQGGAVLLWCANDQMHRFFQAGGALTGDFLRVDSEVGKKDFFGPDTVSTPEASADFIARATRALIFSDLNAPAILQSIAHRFGKTFPPEAVILPEIHRLC